MNFILVLPYYFVWHYGRAYFDIKGVWFNFIVFLYHFFSIPILLRTLFSPWQRIKEGYKQTDSIFETLIFNTIMRVFGFVVRLAFIVIGTASIVLLVVLGIAFYFVWFLLPFILIGVSMWGFKLLSI